jgi:hypothetical protein
MAGEKNASTSGGAVAGIIITAVVGAAAAAAVAILLWKRGRAHPASYSADTTTATMANTPAVTEFALS